MYKFGIYDDEIDVFGLRYARGLLFPLVDIYGLFGYVIRTDTGKPKYITKTTRRSWWMHPNIQAGPVVFVEDIVSAIVVGRVVSTVALLGKNISRQLLELARDEQWRVTVWLDPDATLAAISKVASWASVLGYVPHLVTSHQLDPKFYSRAAIEKFLLTCGAHSGMM